MISKSPFFIVNNFISPMECELIVERSFFEFPNTFNGTPIKSTTRNILTEELVLDYMDSLIDVLEEYYEYEHHGILPFEIEHYPERGKQESVRCENSVYSGNSWSLKNDIALTAILFLKDDNLGTDFDDLFEVHGVKLQFPNHEFSLRPERGQLVVFPSGPNFLNSTVSPKVGDMYQIRIQMVGSNKGSTTPYKYDSSKFPGDYRSWF